MVTWLNQRVFKRGWGWVPKTQTAPVFVCGWGTEYHAWLISKCDLIMCKGINKTHTLPAHGSYGISGMDLRAVYIILVVGTPALERLSASLPLNTGTDNTTDNI